MQATMPLVVFMVGCGFGTEKFTLTSAVNMVIVGTGIAIASYGEECAVATGPDVDWNPTSAVHLSLGPLIPHSLA